MKLQLLAGAVILGTAAGVAFAQESVTVKIGQQNKSKESGSAKLTPQGDGTKVEVSLKGGPKGTPQPAHIHNGSCAKLDPKPKYGLENVVDGKSTTVVPVKLDELLKGKMAINVHKSADDLKTYVACGDIKGRAGAAKKKKE